MVVLINTVNDIKTRNRRKSYGNNTERGCKMNLFLVNNVDVVQVF